MNIFKPFRLFLRKKLRDISKWYLERYGYFILEKKNLYDWQLNPNFNSSYNIQTKIPDESREYLILKNPRLVNLKSDYKTFLRENFRNGLWTEDYLKNENLLYFRGDNPFVHQRRGNQLSV